MITTNYSTQATPNFQAKLNFNNIELENTVKEAAVKKLFETKTGHYKEGQLDLIKNKLDRDNGTFFYNVDIKSEDADLGFFANFRDFKKWFNNTSVKDIADQLAHVYKFGKLRTKNIQTEKAIRKNIHSATVSMNSNLNRAEIMAEEGNNAVSNRYSTMAEINSKRLATLNNTLAKTVERNSALEKKVSATISDEIYIDPNLERDI